jgi:epsilon-lactone hydrolase
MAQASVHSHRRRNTILIIALALLALAIGAMKISSVRSGESMATHFVRVAVLPMLRVKSTMKNVDRYREIVQSRQADGDAPPSDRLKNQFHIRTESIGGYLYYVVSPKTSKSNRVIIYIHGGAYVGPMAEFQWNLVEGLAERTGAQLIVPNYPLAPKHDWRDAYAMMVQLYDILIQPVTLQAAGWR